MDKFVSRTKRNLSSTPEPSSTGSVIPLDQNNEKRPCIEVEVSDDDIIGDPGLRKPIDSYPFEIRDSLRRRYLAKGPCQPVGHQFPPTNYKGVKRRFQSLWFKKFAWLEYSVSKDKAFCLYCYLFGNSNKNGGNAFTEIGYNNWKNAITNFVAHEGGLGSSHSLCRTKVDQYQNQRENVDYVLSEKSAALEGEYRTRLTVTLDVARFLLGEGLAFRGHDESPESLHRGHFLKLISWYCERNVEVKKVIQNAPKNNILTSPSIQRDIIESCAMETRKVILSEIGDKFFSLLVDEARDSSVKEQMAIVLRFVGDNGEVNERFLGVVHVSDTSAQSLKDAIDAFFAKNGLSLSRLRGQGYDGASNMRGELNGLKALILNENKHAYYIHCFAHQLQLAVVSAAQDKDVVSQFFDYVSMIVNLVGASCKRKDALHQLHHEEVISKIQSGELSTGKGQNQEISLARPGDTRWGSHYKTLIRLFDMWDSVGEVLNAINRDGTDAKMRGTAKSLDEKMFTFEFAFVGKLMLHILGMTNTLSQILQAKDQNIGSAISMVEVVKKNLQAYRQDGWEKLLEDVTKFCEDQEIHVPNMEDIIPCRSKKLVDGQPKTHFHHFRLEIFIKVIDLVAQELENRFTESNTDLLRCIMCLDPTNSFANFDNERLLHLARLYSKDFSSGELVELDHQLQLYISYMRSQEEFSQLRDIGALAKKMVEKQYHTYFPLVYRLIELALVLPVATSTVERFFSAMNIVNTDLRNRMGDELLSDCLLRYVEKKAFISVENEAILQCFQKLKSRRKYLPPSKSSRTMNESSSSVRKT